MVTVIGDPRAQGNGSDRHAGVNTVRSSGAAAAAHEAALLVASHHSDAPSYVMPFAVNPVAAMDVFALRAPANKVLRVRRVVLVNPGSATAAAVVDLSLGVATGAVGSGGAAGAPVPLDPSARASGVTGGPDGAFGGVARVGDTTQAAGYAARYGPLQTVSVPAAAGGFNAQSVYNLPTDEILKPLTVSGTDLVVLRVPAVGAGAANMRGYVEFTVDDA